MLNQALRLVQSQNNSEDDNLQEVQRLQASPRPLLTHILMIVNCEWSHNPALIKQSRLAPQTLK